MFQNLLKIFILQLVSFSYRIVLFIAIMDSSNLQIKQEYSNSEIKHEPPENPQWKIPKKENIQWIHTLHTNMKNVSSISSIVNH
jgi:hypothetical protein